ncbi:MAG TPA: hypothetical protein VI454_08270, partial [Verrucomicrobiae bacterium]
MNPNEHLSDDGQTILLLCSTLALPETATDATPTPLTLREWNELARKIDASPLKQPCALQGLGAGELEKALAL